MSLFFANFVYNPSVVNPKMPTPHKNANELLSKLKATQQVLFDNLNKSVLTYKKFANCENCKDLVKIFETKDKTLGGNVMNHIHDAGKVFPLFCSFSMERRRDAATSRIKVYIRASLESNKPFQ